MINAKLFWEFHRILKPGGRALIVTHKGDMDETLTRIWGRDDLSIPANFHREAELAGPASAAGFIVDRIDRDRVVNYLTKDSYWARNRDPRKIEKSIENSLCFSLIEAGRFTGFARIITDCATFSYICDLFILPEYQNRNYGTFLVESILNDEEIKDTFFVLFTQTAHRFYERFGFHRNGDRMERVMFR